MDGLVLAMLLLCMLVVSLWLGYYLAQDKDPTGPEEPDVQRRVLDLEWETLKNLRRINEVFLDARDGMRRAERERRRASRSGPDVVDGEWE